MTNLENDIIEVRTKYNEMATKHNDMVRNVEILQARIASIENYFNYLAENLKCMSPKICNVDNEA